MHRKWEERVEIFLAEKWLDKFVNITKVSDSMNVDKVFAQKIIISLISDLTV